MGETKPKEKYIFERVYVETPVDTDGDGKYDLIALYIKRPKDTLIDKKVPVIFVANPYLMTCNEDWYVPHNVDMPVAAFDQQCISEKDVKFDFSKEILPEITFERKTEGYADTAIIDEDIEFECISDVYGHFIDRGYALVFSGGLGTLGSEGFTITGSREEVFAFKSVIDWLNGRCRAFTNKTDNVEIKAKWSTGNVAMSAKSYLGTMCIGVATTGVEGLKTIIPEAAISNWYDYYRCNGLNLPAIGWQGDDLDILAKYCFSRAKDPEDYSSIKEAYDKVLDRLVSEEDRLSGNYNKFWDERNYLNLIKNIKASVFIIHGINDWNVKTNQCLPFFQLLQENNIPRKMVLHQGEHIYIYNLKESNMLEILDRWLDFYLLGIDTGIEKESKILIESNLNQEEWFESECWPPAGHKVLEYNVKSNGIGEIIDDLSKTAYCREKDNLKDWLDQLALSQEADFKNRLRYELNISDQIKEGESFRITGGVKISFDGAIDKKTAIISAMLVDYGREKRLTSEEVAEDKGQFSFGYEAEPSEYRVISRGWLNAQNRTCNYCKEEITPGEYYNYSLDMVPTEYIVKGGHTLGLIIYGIDAQATQRPDEVTRISVKENSIKINIPYVLN